MSAAGPAPAPGPADRARLFSILSSPWLAQACYALVKFGIPDLLAEGPRGVAELAAASGTDRRALHRMLRALAAGGLVRQTAPGTFELTALGQPLRTGVTRSSRDAAIMFGEEVFRSLADISYTLRTGQPAFDKVYGLPFYDYLARNPQAAATFTAAMGQAPVPPALAACDLSGARTIVDVGGGNGGLLSWVLRANPRARGVLLDLPPAVAQARAALAGDELAGRVEFAEGSFFEQMPAGADVYVLSRVLHNWPDEQAAAVLARIRGAIAPGGRLLVFEELIETGPRDGQDGHNGQAAPPGPARGSVMDLLILVMLSGCDRSEAEYRELLAAAGFGVTAVRAAPVRSRQAESLIEAVPG
ncbi:MAG TPA: methyltransferase [Streptosporangiaceae bacterium]